ncbi:MAG: peroxide stress protein YaaA [Bullifex sp.]
MRIIISPAKKMRRDIDAPFSLTSAHFEKDARYLVSVLREMSVPELSALWKTGDKLTRQAKSYLDSFDPALPQTPAILAYDGIAFRYMAPSVFEQRMMDYVQAHLRIISGLYGVLRPLDGVSPYRLEMQAPLAASGGNDLYEYWGRRIHDEVYDGDDTVINLASKEYSDTVEPYIGPGERFVNVNFAELKDGSPVIRATYAKMARGEMVRFLAQHEAEDAEVMKEFDGLGFSFEESLSSSDDYWFLRK